MHAFVAELLVCPVCHGDLAWRVASREGDRIEEAQAHCRRCDLDYPVRAGIGHFLPPDLRLSESADASGTGLAGYLREHPEVEAQLMGAPVESLNPTDQFFRAGVLRHRGKYTEAERLERSAQTGLYTVEQQAATRRQIEHLIGLLAGQEGVIVDLASGRGLLAERMLEALPNPVVLTDVNPRVLEEDRLRLAAPDRVSYIALDARRTPFRDGAVGVMTTYAGLGNVEQPGPLLRELRRVVSGRFLALCQFCPEEDQANGALLKQAGMEQMYFRRLALASFTAAGWRVRVSHSARARVAPTPPSAILTGVTVDGFPISESAFEFCVLEAR